MKRLLFPLLFCLMLAACAAPPVKPVPSPDREPWSPPATSAPLSEDMQNMLSVLSACEAYVETLSANYPEVRVTLDERDIVWIEAHLSDADSDLRALILDLRQQTFRQIEDVEKSGRTLPEGLEQALAAFEEEVSTLGW